jgi:SagB-type dehydrogenase family enzyme
LGQAALVAWPFFKEDFAMDMPSVDSIYEIQTNKSLVIVPLDDDGESGSVGVYEFISKSFARCPVNTLYWLSYFKRPKSLTKAYHEHPDCDKTIVRSEIEALLEAKFLLHAGTEFEPRSVNFAKNWEWDISTALFHFTVTDNPFMSDEEAKQNQLQRLKCDPPPAFWWSPSQKEAYDVTKQTSAQSSELLNIMRKRRTNRTSTHEPVTLTTLASCLYAGLGIVGTIKATSGDVPLSMTPSGGARNPYEAFAIVRRGADIPPGIYHYCAAEQVIEKIDEFDPSKPIAELFGSQDWVDEMSVIVVLVAVFERMMWKYQDPNAYRVMLLQAGHISQNIMLRATELGYTVCPTAAMSHSKVSKLLKLQNSVLHAPIYALSIDKPSSNNQVISLIPTALGSTAA